MRAIGIAAAFVCLSTGMARADLLDSRDWQRRIDAFTRSLLVQPTPDREIIVPPDRIDPKMVLVPPAGGAMQVIRPPQVGRR